MQFKILLLKKGVLKRLNRQKGGFNGRGEGARLIMVLNMVIVVVVSCVRGAGWHNARAGRGANMAEEEEGEGDKKEPGVLSS